MKVKKFTLNGRTVLALVLAGTMIFITGFKKQQGKEPSIYRSNLPVYDQQKEDDYKEPKMDPAILPEEPNYEVVLEKKKRRKNGKWVA